MTTEADLLAAVSAEPADGAGRLVYADWLEEHGDERGEYLRVEHELRSTSPFVPRYWELKDRRNELRPRCDPAWLEAVGFPTYYTPLFTTLPDDRESRWRLVDRFIDFWHDEPLTAESGNTEEELAAAEERLGVKLPAALREWYRLAGRRVDIWSKQDSLLDLRELVELQLHPETLTFRIENQNCERWGVHLADVTDPDPSVHRIVGRPTIQTETVSEFAIQMLLLETIFIANSGGHLSDSFVSDLEIVRSTMPRSDVSSTYWCLDLKMYEERDLLLVHREGDSFSYVAARNETALAQLPRSMQESLERWD